MKNTELAYFAGILDGEGTITLSRNYKDDKWRVPVISFPSTSIELINAFNKLFGGSVINKKTYQKHHKKSWECRLQYNRALNFIRLVRPYLLHSEKIRRADILLTRYKAVTPRNGKYNSEQTKLKKQFEYDFFHPSTS